MLTALPDLPEDQILRVMAQFRSDPRPEKLDLGVGVYRDPQGQTPVMRAIRTAGQRVWEAERSKGYVGLAGDPAFNTAMVELILGGSVARDRVACVATPGGTGAVHQALEMVTLAGTGATVWVSDPTWPNHLSLLRHRSVPHRSYRYFDRATGEVRLDAMLEDLGGTAPGDVVLLHGCCHNPTGTGFDRASWAELAAFLSQRGLVPLIDLAYLGLGDGLEADAAGLRQIAGTCPETLIAASCSKSFGIYRDRAGVLIATAAAPGEAARAQAALAHLNRQTFCFPPDHGARLVTTVLEDADLRADWEAELGEMRTRVQTMRDLLADALQRHTNTDRFAALARHRGMFSLLGLTPDQMEALRRDHAVYAISDSRINIAGLTEESVPVFAQAVGAVLAAA